MGEPIKTKTSRRGIGFKAFLAAIFAAIVIGAGYETHPRPPLTPAQEDDLWQTILTAEVRHARECERNVDLKRKMDTNALSDQSWEEVRRKCWDDWRDLEDEASQDQQRRTGQTQ